MTNNPIIQIFAPNPLGDTVRTLPARGVATGDGGAAVTVQMAGTTDGGALVTALIGDTSELIVTPPNAVRVQAFLLGHHIGTDTYQPVTVLYDTDDAISSGPGNLSTIARLVGNSGTGWDRIQTASAFNMGNTNGHGASKSTAPSEWSVERRPPVDIQATVTRAAAVGARHVAKSITWSMVAVAAQTLVDVLLRDGAAGVGTVLWSQRVQVPAGDSRQVTVSGLNIVGSSDAAMTLEFSAAPVATNYQGVALTGYDCI